MPPNNNPTASCCPSGEMAMLYTGVQWITRVQAIEHNARSSLACVCVAQVFILISESKRITPIIES
jgi:hypothetical protein